MGDTREPNLRGPIRELLAAIFEAVFEIKDRLAAIEAERRGEPVGAARVEGDER